MTALEQNAELLRQISYVVEDEELTAKVLKYVKRLLSSTKHPSHQVAEGLDEMCEQINQAKNGTLKGRPVDDLIYEYYKERQDF